MEIDTETFQEIIWEDHEDFEAITKTKIGGNSRWSIYKNRVFGQKSTGKFFEAYWGEGATEYQEGQNEAWTFTEVVPREVVTIEYDHVKGGQSFKGNMG
jgi:hypothetical protein